MFDFAISHFLVCLFDTVYFLSLFLPFSRLWTKNIFLFVMTLRFLHAFFFYVLFCLCVACVCGHHLWQKASIFKQPSSESSESKQNSKPETDGCSTMAKAAMIDTITIIVGEIPAAKEIIQPKVSQITPRGMTMVTKRILARRWAHILLAEMALTIIANWVYGV